MIIAFKVDFVNQEYEEPWQKGIYWHSYTAMIKFLHSPPSSSGPGRGPLKAKTGIRIPLGALNTVLRTGHFFYVRGYAAPGKP